MSERRERTKRVCVKPVIPLPAPKRTRWRRSSKTEKNIKRGYRSKWGVSWKQVWSKLETSGEQVGSKLETSGEQVESK